jgi:hypothetical protein
MGWGLFVHPFQGLGVVEAKVTSVNDELSVESLCHGIDLREFACTRASDRVKGVEGCTSDVCNAKDSCAGSALDDGHAICSRMVSNLNDRVSKCNTKARLGGIWAAYLRSHDWSVEGREYEMMRRMARWLAQSVSDGEGRGREEMRGKGGGTHVDMGCDVNGYRTRRDADSGKAEMQSTNARTNDASSSTTTNTGGERDGQQRGRNSQRRQSGQRRGRERGKRGDNGGKVDRGRTVIGCVKHREGG